MMVKSLVRRIAKVSDAQWHKQTDAHRARMVIAPGHWKETDPFLLLAEGWYRPGVFDEHPHRGFETTTLVIGGEVEHHDNHGGSGRFSTDDMLWLTAGRGVIHNEVPQGREPAHIFQLWINLPAALKMMEPEYQLLRGAGMPVQRTPGTELRVFSGTISGLRALTRNHVPIAMAELRVDPGASVSPELPASYNGFIYVIDGSARIGADATAVRAGQVAWLSRHEGGQGSQITIKADEQLHAVLWAGQPLDEPVSASGPFVMNTPEQIQQAFADYRGGKF
jgi:quercetin 2,3-dioxygenase